MSASKPPKIKGMHHIALNVVALESCERFYTEVLGFAVEWRPDADNLYLSSGSDNLALHRAHEVAPQGALDHIGLIVHKPEHVDLWHAFLSQNDVPIDAPPRTHRDGARSLYCRDPENNLVQIIYHPPLSE